MSKSRQHRQTPSTQHDESESTPEGEERDAVVEADGTTFESLVDEQVESSVEELRAEIRRLEEQVEAVDNFARISLNERKVKQNEVKLGEFSDSLTAFAEKAFNKLNHLEERLDTQALVLAALVDAQGDDVDLTAVDDWHSGRRVLDATPDEQLVAAVEASVSAPAADDD